MRAKDDDAFRAITRVSPRLAQLIRRLDRSMRALRRHLADIEECRMRGEEPARVLLMRYELEQAKALLAAAEIDELEQGDRPGRRTIN